MGENLRVNQQCLEIHEKRVKGRASLRVDELYVRRTLGASKRLLHHPIRSFLHWLQKDANLPPHFPHGVKTKWRWLHVKRTKSQVNIYASPQDETWTDFDGPSWIQYNLFRKNKLQGSKKVNLARFMLPAYASYLL